MCTIRIQVQAQCYDKFSEIIPAEHGQLEFFIEEVVGLVLHRFFDDASIDDVIVYFSPRYRTGLRYCSLTIYAQCACKSFALSPSSHHNVKRTLEESLTSVLKELFICVNIDDMRLHHYLQECELAPMPLYRY